MPKFVVPVLKLAKIPDSTLRRFLSWCRSECSSKFKDQTSCKKSSSSELPKKISWLWMGEDFLLFRKLGCHLLYIFCGQFFEWAPNLEASIWDFYLLWERWAFYSWWSSWPYNGGKPVWANFGPLRNWAKNNRTAIQSTPRYLPFRLSVRLKVNTTCSWFIVNFY